MISTLAACTNALGAVKENGEKAIADLKTAIAKMLLRAGSAKARIAIAVLAAAPYGHRNDLIIR